MVAIPESGPSVEVNIFNDDKKREGKASGSLMARENYEMGGGPKSDFEGQGSPATPEALKQRDAREAAVVKEIRDEGLDDKVVLRTNEKEDRKQVQTVIKLLDNPKDSQEYKLGLEIKDNFTDNQTNIYNALTEKTRKFLGGMADELLGQTSTIKTQKEKKPNVVSSAPDMETIHAMDRASTTQGQQELEQASLDPNRQKAQEGGMAMPPELMQQSMPTEEPPVDTYPNIPPEEMAEVEASQLPDDEMEDDYLDFIVSESLSGQEQQYLMESLEADPQLSSIIDKLVLTASEFTGQGEVDGPGTGVSDSIPARLSDGEFVFTRKATDQLGADNLQTMMDDAERAYDGGLQKYALGGAVDDTVLGGAVKDTTPLMDEKVNMYGTNRQQDEMRKQMMYANRMPSIIGT